MPNYATAYDVWKCEPPDSSEQEMALEVACEMAFDDYLEDGYLPGNHDAGHVDSMMTEQRPELLDSLISAKDDEELLALAKEIRDERIKIIEAIIKDNLEA